MHLKLKVSTWHSHPSFNRNGEQFDQFCAFNTHYRPAGWENVEDESHPFHGYFYRILTRRGANAPGGELDCLDADGNLTRGYAVIAWPATYGNSGIMTFMTNHRGLVFEKDLGAETAQLAAAIDRYDPDSSWAPAEDSLTEIEE
jgi:hypothetical protein